MTEPRTTPNPGTSTKPTHSSKKIASKRHLGILPLLLGLLLALVIAGIIVALVLANRSDDDGGSTASPAVVATAPVPSQQSSPSTASTDGTGTGTSTGTGTGTASTLTAGSEELVGLPAARLQALDGQSATGTGTVQSVVSNEGFWVGTSTTDRVFVFLSAAAKKGQVESPYTVKQGDRISLDGTVRTVTPQVESGVTAAEGLGQLQQQDSYVDATRVQLST